MPQNEHNCFDEERGSACPSGLLMIDGGGTIRWLNQALEELLGLRASELLGHSRDTLPVPAYRTLFNEDPVISVADGAGQRWLRRETASVPTSETGNSTLYIYQDIGELVRVKAERDRLSKRVHELTLIDELTGLANRRALHNALDSQVARSRRYHNPLTLMMVRVTLGDDKTLTIPDLPERAVVAVGHFLRDRLRWADIIGRYEPTLFMLILPETDRQAAGVLTDKIRAESAEMELPNDLAELPLELSFGLAEWEQGDDPETLTERAMIIEDTADGSSRTAANSH